MRDSWGNFELSKFNSGKTSGVNGSRILFLCGSSAISGGTNIILNYANALQERGALVSVAFLNDSGKDAGWHPYNKKLRFTSVSEALKDQYDLAIATWWRTLPILTSVKTRKYLYFVQSLESRFPRNYGDRLEESEAAATYFAGVPMVTVADWLARALYVGTGINPWVVKNGINKSVFSVSGKSIQRSSGKLIALVEGPLNVPMKATEKSLEVCAEAKISEIWHVNPGKGKHPLATRTFNEVNFEDMPSILRSIDVIVKLSRVEGMFGPPLEAFHCGATCIATRVSGWDEYLVDGSNSLLVDVDDFVSAQMSLEMLSENQELLEKLKLGAKETALKWNASYQSESQFSQICSDVLESEGEVNLNWARMDQMISDAKALLEAGEDPRLVFPTAICP
jgi:hypothetical protein